MFTSKNIVKFIIFYVCNLFALLFFSVFQSKLDNNKILYTIQCILSKIAEFFVFILDKPVEIICKMVGFIFSVPSRLYDAVCGDTNYQKRW